VRYALTVVWSSFNGINCAASNEQVLHAVTVSSDYNGLANDLQDCVNLLSLIHG